MRVLAGRRGVGHHRGISLVEVLVVMVILILGILAIARLFPEGFASLSFTGNITTAQRLMTLREEELRKDPNGLPDAIAGIDPANSAVILSNIQPNALQSALRHHSIPGFTGEPPADARFSNINVARRVFGEQFQVPPPTDPSVSPVGEGPVSLYRAKFGPIYSENQSLGGAGVAAYSGTPLERVVFSDPPNSDNFRGLARVGHFGYGVNWERGYLYVVSISVPAAGRLFKTDFTYHTGTTMRQSPAGNAMLVPPGQGADDPQSDPAGQLTQFTALRINLNLNPPAIDRAYTHNLQSEATTETTPSVTVGGQFLPAGAVLDAGSDSLYRGFRKVSGPFTTDPFEFKLYDVTTGLFGFNPIAATFPVPNQTGRGIMARIDYDVDDWHILHYDAVVPTAATDPDGSANSGDEVYTIKLPTGAIKRWNDEEETLNFVEGQPISTNSFNYQGLVRYYPDPAPRAGTPGMDVLIVDMQTGFQIDSRTLQRPDPGAPPSSTNVNGEIDYRAGVIRLWKFANRTAGSLPQWNRPFGVGGGAGPTQDAAGKHLRVYYRAANDFGVATFKPFTRFHLQPNLAALQFREYYADPAALPGGFVLFPNMDAEKTVAVDYSYVATSDPSAPSNQALWQRRTVYGELQQVQPPGTAFAPPGGRWWIRVSHADAGGAPSGNDPSVIAGSVQILGVRGASLHTRVAWLEGKRMRHRERSTLLQREATR